MLLFLYRKALQIARQQYHYPNPQSSEQDNDDNSQEITDSQDFDNMGYISNIVSDTMGYISNNATDFQFCSPSENVNTLYISGFQDSNFDADIDPNNNNNNNIIPNFNPNNGSSGLFLPFLDIDIPEQNIDSPSAYSENSQNLLQNPAFHIASNRNNLVCDYYNYCSFSNFEYKINKTTKLLI